MAEPKLKRPALAPSSIELTETGATKNGKLRNDSCIYRFLEEWRCGALIETQVLVPVPAPFHPIRGFRLLGLALAWLAGVTLVAAQAPTGDPTHVRSSART